jgi:hypothetical protein
MKRLFLLTLLMCSILLPLSGERTELVFGADLPADAAQRGEQLSVKLLTVGQGDPVYLWYGHIALVIEDHARERNLIFDFGVFDFEQENFYTNFAMGRLYYRAVATYLEPRMINVEAQQRNSRILTLNLPPEKRYALYSYLLTHIQEEHAVYLYHHYYDNCSTRIRDVIDYAVDGQLSDWSKAVESEFTYRQHIRRYSEASPIMDFLLNFLQSSVIDRPISLWDEFFLPDRLERALLDFSYIDEQGVSRKLVTDSQVMTSFASRNRIPEKKDAPWGYALLIGIAWASLGLILIMKAGNTGEAIFHMVHGLILGVLGTVLLFMMIATDHDVTYGNMNILLANPIHLLIITGGILMLFNRKRAIRVIRIGYISTLVLTCFLPAVQILSTFNQHNQLSAALIAPGNILLGAWMLAAYIKERRSWNE